MMSFRGFILLIACLIQFAACEDDLIVITVATEQNDGLTRFLRSADNNGYTVKVVGIGTEWRGGDVSKYTGGGHKVNLLKSELSKYKDSSKLIVLFVDSYDVIFMDSKERLLEEYHKLGSRVIFGAEDFCWPQKHLEKMYPPVEKDEKRFLNSGAFIGPASDLYQIVSLNAINDDEDDQLYYTQIFLDEKYREKYNIGLDKSSQIIQNLNGALSEVEIKFSDTTGYLYNNRTKSNPIIAHGNGPIKVQFNSLTNYLDFSWTPTHGCQHCDENTIDMTKPGNFPIIQLSVFIDRPTPFLDVFFERIAALTYPKNRIHFTGYIAENAELHRKLAEKFNTTYGEEYRTSVWFDSKDAADEGSARDRAMAYCLAIEDCQFMLAVDGVVQITAPNLVEHLVHMNRSILAPLVTRRGKLWSNFWGALTPEGYYERSDDYVDIVEGNKRGIWNVPFVRDIYLQSRQAIRKLAETKFAGKSDVDMVVAQEAIKRNIFMMVDNQETYGYLIFADTYSVDHIHNDLWQIFDNPQDWEEQYVHKGYFDMIAPHIKMEDFKQPCPDVFWFPIVTEKFCNQLIEELEAFNQWSDGSNFDPRLEGGYENVPTRDIHMRQIDWEKHWLHFLVKYIHPIQKIVFEGYDDKPWARMNFVVRYRPDEQPSLRAHHDASSYTLNIALNEPGKAYEGGGTNFLRYNCALTKPIIGWTAMFPGRVTHLHEGLTTTAGTRYIFVTFVNP